MRQRRYIAPPGDFTTELCADPMALLRELVDARIAAVEREALRPEPSEDPFIWFEMREAGDTVEKDGGFVNGFEHLLGTVRRERRAYDSWVGPMPVASLQRVLDGRIEWRPPETRDAQAVLDAFAVARIAELDISVDQLLQGAYELSRAADKREWNLDGLTDVSASKAWSLDRLQETNSGAEKASVWDNPDHGDGPDPTEGFDGIYARVRALVHAVVFGTGDTTPRPQVLPRQPGIVLSVAYTLEFFTRWERGHEELVERFIDVDRGAWTRLALTSARAVDATAKLNSLEQQCSRTATTFPDIMDVLRQWSDDAQDDPEPPAENDEDR